MFLIFVTNTNAAHGIQSSSTSSNTTTSDYLKSAPINEALLDEVDHQALEQIKLGDLFTARQLINQAIDGTNFSQQPRSLINRLLIRATLDRTVGANISALQDLQFAFRLAASTNQQDLVADVAFTIAQIHQARNEHSIALSYAEQAINKYQQQNATAKYAQTLMMSISSLLASQQLETAMDYLEKVKPYVTDANNILFKAHYFRYLGELQLYQENSKESLATLQIAIKLVPENNPQELATLHLLLSQAYTIEDEMDEAIEHLVTAFSFADKTHDGSENSFYLNQTLQLHRANLLGQLNEFEAAFKVTQDVLKDRDLHQPIAEIKRMLDMHANFQLELQQQENAELKEENQWKTTQIESKQMLNSLFFLIIGLLFCISCLLLLLFLRGRKHRISLEKIAHTDALTGLHSRSRVLDLLGHHQDLFARNQQAYCVAIVDLDYFKKINDTYGHPTGDKVLKQFGDICHASFRRSDVIGRIGGEEFLIILPNTDIKKAVEVFNVFNAKLPIIAKSLKLSKVTTASIGVVSPVTGETPMNIVKRADKALYLAKGQGRNQVVIGENVAPTTEPNLDVKQG